ncbi:hypothetical protein CPLU01_00069 [Colletotrichum plurivorum]|uniref:Uncharacterized protein n=1 Tax=Colletotrichum plurivorum TaxID=2175906 RepID=A0A8H6U6E5_9PEZI|nr:hypothetical protein CPLU01_00069 [Colletotrichum plurivorum]
MAVRKSKNEYRAHWAALKLEWMGWGLPVTELRTVGMPHVRSTLHYIQCAGKEIAPRRELRDVVQDPRVKRNGPKTPLLRNNVGLCPSHRCVAVYDRKATEPRDPSLPACAVQWALLFVATGRDHLRWMADNGAQRSIWPDPSQHDHERLSSSRLFDILVSGNQKPFDSMARRNRFHDELDVYSFNCLPERPDSTGLRLASGGNAFYP